MLEQIDQLSVHLLGNVDSLMERATAAARSLKDRTASGNTPGRGAILDLLQDPEEKAAISHLTAVMSLLEGHANVVMDAVDASIIPSVKTIRQRTADQGDEARQSRSADRRRDRRDQFDARPARGDPAVDARHRRE